MVWKNIKKGDLLFLAPDMKSTCALENRLGSELINL